MLAFVLEVGLRTITKRVVLAQIKDTIEGELS